MCLSTRQLVTGGFHLQTIGSIIVQTSSADVSLYKTTTAAIFRPSFSQKIVLRLLQVPRIGFSDSTRNLSNDSASLRYHSILSCFQHEAELLAAATSSCCLKVTPKCSERWETLFSRSTRKPSVPPGGSEVRRVRR